MTVLSLAVTVAYEIGVQVPTTMVSPTTANDLIFLTNLISECRYLRSQKVFPQQKKTWTISVVAGTTGYPFPIDFYSNLPDTGYTQGNHYPLNSPTSDSDWNQNLYGEGSTTYTAYRPFGLINGLQQLKIFPTPTTTDTLSFDYITKNMFQGANTPFTLSETIANNSDTTLFDEDLVIAGLKWRYLKAKGQEYAQEKEEHDRMVDAGVARFFGSRIGSMGRDNWGGPMYYIKDRGRI